MLYPTMDTLLKTINNRYMLVNVTAKRARDLSRISAEDGEPLLEKTVKTALQEISDGKVYIRGTNMSAEG